MSSYTADIDPSVRGSGTGHCRRPTTVCPLPRDASNGALSRANAPNARSSTARGRERNGHNRGGKTSTLRRQRLGMPLSRRGDALVTCSREPAMRKPPTRLVTATKVASTGDTRTPIVRVDLLRLEGAFEPLHGCDRSFLMAIAAPRAVHSIFTWF